jgi:hypothetical protein
MHAIALLDNLDRASIEMLEALNQLILIAPRRLGDLAENSPGSFSAMALRQSATRKLS